MDDSELDDLILLKLGENYEKLENSEKSFEYYKEYHNKYKNKKDYSYAVEKLLINRLNENKINEAKVYFEELQRINPDRAKIYTDYLK
jgi:tetratricopeptide (TPR) repeat protein